MSSLFDHPRINYLRAILEDTFTPEGVELYIRNAEKKGWSFEETLQRADQLASGAFS